MLLDLGLKPKAPMIEERRKGAWSLAFSINPLALKKTRAKDLELGFEVIDLNAQFL